MNLITTTKATLTLLLLLFFCSCDDSSPKSLPSTQKNKASEDIIESIKPTPKVVRLRDQREVITNIKTGQDETKNYESLKSPIIYGTPKLPYPSENLLK